MKNNILGNLFVFCLTLIAFTSCNDNYYEDSGVHDPKFEGTAVDYIKSRKDVFDSLYKVIQLSGLESALNQEGVTFFAPGDASIRRAIFSLNRELYSRGRDTILTLDQVDPSVWQEYLSMYIFNDSYLLKDIPQVDTVNLNVFPGQGFISFGGTNMNIGVNYNDVVSTNSAGVPQVVKYAGYRQLFISYIRSVGNIGGWGGMVNAPVASSDIQTRNGVIHALEYRRHTFGFVTNNFVNSAYTKGIIYK